MCVWCMRSPIESLLEMRCRPLFLYLMVSQNQPYIGISSNPFQRVLSQNRVDGMAPGAKWTRLGAPNWVVDLVIGPFYKGARAFHAQWRRESRKTNCRIVHGCLKTIRYADKGLHVWARKPSYVKRLVMRFISRNKRLIRVSKHIDINTTPA
jgi:hypothetical protein